MSNMAALVAGRPYTRADLEQTPDDGRRYEVIDGFLVVSAAPGLRHQNAVVALTVQLYNARATNFHVVTGPFAVALADDTEIVVWELGEDGLYRQVAKAVGDEAVVLTKPYPVTIVPADLVR